MEKEMRVRKRETTEDLFFERGLPFFFFSGVGVGDTTLRVIVIIFWTSKKREEWKAPSMNLFQEREKSGVKSNHCFLDFTYLFNWKGNLL